MLCSNKPGVEARNSPQDTEAVVAPITTFKLKDCSTEDKQRWNSIAYEALRKGEVAILLMAGGQVLFW